MEKGVAHVKKDSRLLCLRSGHNANPVPCPFDRNYRNDSPPEFVDPEPGSPEVAVPRGRKFTDLSRAPGWFADEALREDEVKATLEAHIAELRQSASWASALRKMAVVVHKASNFVVYVGRTGASLDNLLGRFRDHKQNRRGQWIYPVIRASTARMREEDWEKHAIEWVQARHREGLLCCNNDVADSRGNWPQTDDCLIYIVACERRVVS